MLQIRCTHCEGINKFDQPYAYHAGLGNEGFLYSESGTATLVWDSYDPDYMAIVGQKHPWALDARERLAVERALALAPNGDCRRSPKTSQPGTLQIQPLR